jgi:hypothetical protein
MAKAPGIKPLTARGLAAKQLKGRARMMFNSRKMTCLVCNKTHKNISLNSTPHCREGVLPCGHGVRIFEPTGKPWVTAVFYPAIVAEDGVGYWFPWEDKPWEIANPIRVEIFGKPFKPTLGRPKDEFERERIRAFNQAIGAGRTLADLLASHFYASSEKGTGQWETILYQIYEYFGIDRATADFMECKLLESAPLPLRARKHLAHRIWQTANIYVKAFILSMGLQPEGGEQDIVHFWGGNH